MRIENKLITNAISKRVLKMICKLKRKWINKCKIEKLNVKNNFEFKNKQLNEQNIQ